MVPVGASTEMRRLYPLCDKLAQSDVPVIIEGDAGTGKELLAECLHEQGPRADAPFVVLLPGIRINTSPTDYFPLEELQMRRFNGEVWELFGPIMSGEIGS